MLIDEKIDYLQKLTQQKITYDDIASVLGVTRSAVQNRIARQSPLRTFEEEKINSAYHIMTAKDTLKNIPSDIVPNNIINIPYWENLPKEFRIPDFTCVTAERDVIKNHWSLDPESLRIIPMLGDKMSNYWYKINDNDILIIDISHNYIMGNGVYFATSQNNTRFWIREMQILINGDTQIKGYSPSGDTVKVFSKQELDNVDFKLIGKVIKNVSFRL